MLVPHDMGCWNLASKYDHAPGEELSPVRLEEAFANVAERLADEQSRRALEAAKQRGLNRSPRRLSAASPTSTPVKASMLGACCSQCAASAPHSASPRSSPSLSLAARGLDTASPRGSSGGAARVSRKPLTLAACAKQSTAMGDGLSMALAGSAASFIVQGCSASGHPVIEAGLLAPLLAVKIAGSGACTHSMESQLDGTVRVWYTPSVSGRYVLRVTIRSEPIPGSPFEVLVAPPLGSASPRQLPLRREGDSGGRSPRGGGSSGGTLDLAGGGGALSPRHGKLKASHLALCVPEGLLAYAMVGQRARIALRALDGGYLRPADASRLKCILHLQRPWCPEPPDAEVIMAVNQLRPVTPTTERGCPTVLTLHLLSCALKRTCCSPAASCPTHSTAPTPTTGRPRRR